MKKNGIFLWAMALLVFVASCDDDDNDNKWVAQDVQTAFDERYPSASRVEWERENGYWKVEFYDNKRENDAWFGPDGKWYMTETDWSFALLPEQVKESFKASEYADWRIEDVDLVQRDGFADIYVIEVERKDRDIDLHYTADGVLIKSVVGEDGGNHLDITEPLMQSIVDFVEAKYPGAFIMEIDREASGIEVDIVDGRISKDLLFDYKYNWVSTTYDVRYSTLPDLVKKAVQEKVNIGLIEIDDVEFVETPNSSYYQIEVEPLNGREYYLKISPEGVVL